MHDFLSIWWSVLTGFDDRFGNDSLNLRLRLELLSAFSQKKVVQSPTCNATHSKAWISLALMDHNKSWDKINNPTLEKGLQNSHRRNSDAQSSEAWLKQASPRSPKFQQSKKTITCFCPVRIQHPLSSNPFLCCSDELVLATLFQKHPDAIQEVSYHMKFLIRVFIANWFEKWCHWNHSK